MRQYRFFLFLVLCCSYKVTFSQIGQKRSSIEAFVGKEQILLTRQEGSYIAQDILTGFNEVTMVLYNKDSIAVAVMYGIKDSSYSDAHIATTIKNNLPDFVSQQTGGKELVSYYKDTQHQYLVMVNHRDLKARSPIVGFGFTTDPELMQLWLEDVELFDAGK